MKNAKRELKIGIFFFVLSVAYLLGSLTIASYTGYGDQAVDSKFMPRVLGILMAGLSVIRMVGAIKQLRLENKGDVQAAAAQTTNSAATAASPDEAKESFDEDAYVKGSSLHSFVVIAGLLVLYVAAFKPLGFILSSIAFLFGAMLFLTPKEKRNWLWIVGLSVVIPIAVYFLFVSGFKLKLPGGILNF